MGRAGVRTAEGRAFADPEPALAYLRAAQAEGPRLVIKADWLAAGKGVIVPETLEEAEAGVSSLMDGASDGSQLVLEERLSGREVSVFALVSGEQVLPR